MRLYVNASTQLGTARAFSIINLSYLLMLRKDSGNNVSLRPSKAIWFPNRFRRAQPDIGI